MGIRVLGQNYGSIQTGESIAPRKDAPTGLLPTSGTPNLEEVKKQIDSNISAIEKKRQEQILSLRKSYEYNQLNLKQKYNKYYQDIKNHYELNKSLIEKSLHKSDPHRKTEMTIAQNQVEQLWRNCKELYTRGGEEAQKQMTELYAELQKEEKLINAQAESEINYELGMFNYYQEIYNHIKIQQSVLAQKTAGLIDELNQLFTPEYLNCGRFSLHNQKEWHAFNHLGISLSKVTGFIVSNSFSIGGSIGVAVATSTLCPASAGFIVGALAGGVAISAVKSEAYEHIVTYKLTTELGDTEDPEKVREKLAEIFSFEKKKTAKVTIDFVQFMSRAFWKIHLNYIFYCYQSLKECDLILETIEKSFLKRSFKGNEQKIRHQDPLLLKRYLTDKTQEELLTKISEHKKMESIAQKTARAKWNIERADKNIFSIFMKNFFFKTLQQIFDKFSNECGNNLLDHIIYNFGILNTHSSSETSYIKKENTPSTDTFSSFALQFKNSTETCTYISKEIESTVTFLINDKFKNTLPPEAVTAYAALIKDEILGDHKETFVEKQAGAHHRKDSLTKHVKLTPLASKPKRALTTVLNCFSTSIATVTPVRSLRTTKRDVTTGVVIATGGTIAGLAIAQFLAVKFAGTAINGISSNFALSPFGLVGTLLGALAEKGVSKKIDGVRKNRIDSLVSIGITKDGKRFLACNKPQHKDSQGNLKEIEPGDLSSEEKEFLLNEGGRYARDRAMLLINYFEIYSRCILNITSLSTRQMNVGEIKGVWEKTSINKFMLPSCVLAIDKFFLELNMINCALDLELHELCCRTFQRDEKELLMKLGILF